MDPINLTLLMVGMLGIVGMVVIVTMVGMVGMVSMVGIEVIAGKRDLVNIFLPFIHLIIPIHVKII